MTDDTIDATEEKAKAIGKELGAVEDDAPDFDIQEVSDDDAPLAKTKETAEEKTTREENLSKSQENRRRKKNKVNSIIEGKDSVIREQAERLAAMEARLSHVDNRLSGINKAEIEKAWADNAATLDRAKKDYLDASNEGDGLKSLNALEIMKAADDRAKELQRIYAQLPVTQQTQTVTTQANQNKKADVKAKEWLERNSWYSAAGTDNESILAQRLSQELINEGHDPKSDDFWEELDNKLDKAGIGAVEDDEDEVVVVKPKKRTAPPVGGGSNRGDLNGKKTITLPTSYINMLKANGIWDDIPRRNKIIKERERILREQQ